MHLHETKKIKRQLVEVSSPPMGSWAQTQEGGRIWQQTMIIWPVLRFLINYLPGPSKA